MGTPLPEPSPDGPFGNGCWTGGTFKNPGNPPEFLSVSVSGILPGDDWTEDSVAPPNGGFQLQQTSSSTWSINTGIVIVRVLMGTSFTQFVITTADPLQIVIFEDFQGGCALSGSNDATDPTVFLWYGGTMTITGVQ